jgi:RNA polymerase sigma-70 factor, ECF subfamily
VTDAGADTRFETAALACLEHVARFAMSLTRGESDADDLVQETYLRAFRSRHTFQPDGDMRRWLFTICKHAFLRDRERSERDAVALADDPTDETRDAIRLHNRLVTSGDAGLFDRLDLAPAIAKALDALATPLRTAVVLVDLEGYGYAEAAEIMQVPIGTVRSRLFRARRVLQESLVEYGRDAGLIPAGAERGQR